MQFSESWLRSFCNPPLTTDALCHALTMAGLEVEDTRSAAPPFTGVVVGEIKSINKHPNADKLNVCEVDVGEAALKQIVCGAPNVRLGMRIPAAQIGAVLPAPEIGGKGFEIKLAKMRGVESHGMLCSARELGISTDASGLMDLGDSVTVGQNVREALHLDDTLLTIKLTPNKADCLSVYGVAREVAAITGAPLQAPASATVQATQNKTVPVKVIDTDLCGRFSGRTILGVNAKAATPEWMKRRLESAGQRPISALVDISNYVMLELGRPSHVFDLDTIHGDLEVRWGKAGESLKLLNGNTVSLDNNVGVIADALAVESLAGIMGGDSTAVSLETTNVYVECAFWWPEAIQGRARRFNFSTDAGHRFERGVDYATTVADLERITQLITEICGGAAGPVDDQSPNLPVRKPVTLRVARAQKIIGVPVSADEIANIFTRLGLGYTRSADSFTVTPPSYRFDIEIEEDLIEEVARIYGFEKIPALPPRATAAMRNTPENHRSQHVLRAAMAARDYQEIITYSFVEEAWERDFGNNPNPIKLLNPIASQMSVMRSTLLGGLIHTLRFNLNHKATRVRVFEIGKVFQRDAAVTDGELAVQGVRQPVVIAGLAYGGAHAEQWGSGKRGVDFFDVKADIEALIAPLEARFEPAHDHPAFHPGRCAKVRIAGAPAGYIGELHPKWLHAYDLAQAPIVFELAVKLLETVPICAPEVPSKTPTVRRDIALVVDQSVSCDALLATLNAARAAVVREVSLFDVYQGSGLPVGKKSLAFQVLMQDTSATLTDEITDNTVNKLIQAAQTAHGASLRT